MNIPDSSTRVISTQAKRKVGVGGPTGEASASLVSTTPACGRTGWAEAQADLYWPIHTLEKERKSGRNFRENLWQRLEKRPLSRLWCSELALSTASAVTRVALHWAARPRYPVSNGQGTFLRVWTRRKGQLARVKVDCSMVAMALDLALRVQTARQGGRAGGVPARPIANSPGHHLRFICTLGRAIMGNNGTRCYP